MFEILDPKCEFATDPIGIDTTRPRFSWRLTHPKRGQNPIAYQVIVASSPELLADDRGDLWDSGRQPTSWSPLIEYAGTPLKSRDRGHWKVRVWDAADQPSAWSAPATFEVALLDRADWRAEWIGSPAGRSGKALHFATSFDLPKSIVGGRAYVAGLGWYELQINGRKVGNRVLEPAQTEFSRRVLYSTYDITEYLQQGRNVIGAWVGAGWYGVPKLLLQAEIGFADGTTSEVITGGIGKGGNYWAVTDGPILENSVYDGEVYDARLEKPDWSRLIPEDIFTSGGDLWWNSMLVEPPGGKLVPQVLEPIEVVDTLTPKSVTEPKPGVFVFDNGQNLAGWARLTVSGPRATTVTLRFAESLYPDGTVNQENLRSALARDIYTLKGEGTETWEPRFTYHGFRYVQLEGFPGTPTLDSLRIRVVRTAVAPTSHFDSSHGLVNRIHQAVFWTETSNLHGVPTDCPQRNERMGWLNDMAARSEELVHNFGVSRLLPKWLNDVRDSQDEFGAISDTAPFHWGSRPADPVSVCYVLIPWLLYQHFGDRRAMAEQYEGMKGWVDYLRSRAPDNIVDYSYYGDWAPPLEQGVAGSIGSSAVSKNTPGTLVSTAHYAYAARLFSKIAKVLGRRNDAVVYGQLAEQTAESFNRHFWNEAAGGYGNNNQAANALALYMQLVPEDRKARVLDNLVSDIEAHDYHVTTGNLCTKYILEVLTEMGRGDLAFRLVTQTSYPSWNFMFEHGATTMWERWEEATGRGMNSHNHPMYASVGAWLFRGLAGIQLAADNVGFSHVRIRPVTPEGLDWVEGRLTTIRGEVAARWRRTAGGLVLEATVPVGCRADVELPRLGKSSRLHEGGRALEPGHSGDGILAIEAPAGSFAVTLSGGKFDLEVKAEP